MAFHKDDLIKCFWQHQVKHQSANCFRLGEKVFLVSGSPVLEVIGFNNEEVIVKWKDSYGNKHKHAFKPQMILQYKYACLLIGGDKYKISLN